MSLIYTYHTTFLRQFREKRLTDKEKEGEGGKSKLTQSEGSCTVTAEPLLKDDKCKLLQKYISCKVKMQQLVACLLPWLSLPKTIVGGNSFMSPS